MELPKDTTRRMILLVIIASFLLRIYLSLISVPLNGIETVNPNTMRYIAQTHSLPLLMDGVPPPNLFFYTPGIFLLGAILYALLLPLHHTLAEIALRLISPVFGLLCMILLTHVTMKLFNDKRIALYSLLFFAFLPLGLSLTSYFTLDIELAFFILLAFYLIISGRDWLGAVIFGVAYNVKILALFHSVFFLILLLRKYRHEQMIQILKRLVLFGLIALILIAPWAIRNTVLLHNPVFPIFNDVFDGYKSDVDMYYGNGISVDNFVKTNSIAKLFFGTFGFPEENKDIRFDPYGITKESVQSITGLMSPLAVALFNVWALLILIFSIPIAFGIRILMKKHEDVAWYFLGMTLSVGFVSFINLLVAGETITRYISPMLPFLAIAWGVGFSSILDLKKSSFMPTVALIFVLLMMGGFVATKTYEIHYVSERLHRYDPLFSWIDENIPPGSLLYNSSKVITYFHDVRYTDSVAELSNGGYVIVQDPLQTFGPPLGVSSDLPQGIDLEQIYTHDESKVRIYRVR